MSEIIIAHFPNSKMSDLGDFLQIFQITTNMELHFHPEFH